MFALISGTVNAFDAPARQAFVAEIVPREDLTNAIALNSIQFNVARALAALRDGLARIRGFKGATGDVTVGPERTPEKELFFLTVDQNGLRELTREELATPVGCGGVLAIIAVTGVLASGRPRRKRSRSARSSSADW